MAEYLQIIRSNFVYDDIAVANGMIVLKVAANNERLISTGFASDWQGDPVVAGLPRCETCRCWFISEGMFQGHLNNTHAAGLRTMREARQARIEELARLRDQAATLTIRIDTLHSDVLALDKEIAAKEQELAAARGEITELVPLAQSGRVSLG